MLVPLLALGVEVVGLRDLVQSGSRGEPEMGLRGGVMGVMVYASLHRYT